MYNITRGNTIPMKAILEHEEERFPVAVSTNISVRAYNEYRYIDAENVTVDQEEDGVLYFEIPPTLNTGIFGVEVKGNVNGVSWRTATDGVVKITGATQRSEGSEAVPEGDTYDIVMKVQLYKNQSSDKAIEEHNSDEASHPYILGELERIEGEIPTLPEHIVTDANYVHTDNNYTTEEKTKLSNAITEEQDPTVPQWAKQSTKPSYTPQEVGALPNTTKYGSTIDLSMNSTTYVLTLSLKDQDGTVLNTKTVDLPIESVVVNGRYDAANKKIVLTLQSGSTIDVPVGDLVAGLQTEITSLNMLDADLVDDTNSTHKFVTAQEKTAWNNKSDFSGSYNDLTDKPTIPTVPTNVSAFNNDAGYVTKTVNDLVNYYLKSETYTKSEVQGLIAAIQQFHYEIYASISAVTSPAGNVLYLIGPTGTGADKYEEYVYDATKQEPWVKIGDTSIDLSGYYTSQQTDAAITQALNTALADYTTTTNLTQLLAGKQDVINDLSDIRSGAAAGATAYQKPAGGIPKADLAQGVQDSLDKADTALQEDTLYVKVNNNGHEYVDLGLPSGTLWAKCNVGADAEIGYGNYYMYGKGARQYNSSDSPYTGTEDPLDLSADTARQILGGSWKMPTQVQMQELIDNTTYEFTTINGVNGAKFTALNGNYVFFPAAGYWDNFQYGVGSGGDYWGSSPEGSYGAYYLNFDNGSKGIDGGIRHLGCSVRGVILPEKTQLKQDLDKKQNTLVSGTNIKTLNGESILGSGNINIDISGKEDATTIVAPVNTTDATLPITTLATEVGKYYRLDVAVDTLAVTLPAMENVTTTKTVVLYLTGGTTPAVTISSTAPTGGSAPDVYYQDGYSIEAGKTYEVNCLWNGDAWIVASVEISLT